MDWIRKETETPQDGKRVLVWHRLGGAMLETGAEVRKNPFITHWAETDRVKWTDRKDRLPEARDTDHTGCVLATEQGREARCVRYEFVRNDQNFTRWASLPGKPEK